LWHLHLFVITHIRTQLHTVFDKISSDKYVEQRSEVTTTLDLRRQGRVRRARLYKQAYYDGHTAPSR